MGYRKIIMPLLFLILSGCGYYSFKGALPPELKTIYIENFQTNVAFYTAMQGPSEFGCVGNPRLENWDRNDDLPKIKVPTLTIGAKYDTMDPEQMKWMATQVQNGRYLYCPEGSHLAMYDDQETYFDGLIQFIKDVDHGNFNH